MDLLFRRYFWVVTLAFLASAAFLSARTVNVFVAAELRPKVEVETPAAPRALVTAPPRQELSPEKVAKVMGVVLKPPEPEVPEAPKADPNAPPVKSALRAQLVATILASDKRYSVAAIMDLATRETALYRVGDRILNIAEVIEIDRGKVTFIHEGRLEYLLLNEEGGSGSNVAIAAPVPMPPPAIAEAGSGSFGASVGSGDGVRQISENDYVIERRRLEQVTSNLSQVATEARIVPSFKNGVANGFKLFSIRPGSIYAQIGIQNGDVVRKINGFEINSPDKALEIYQRLKDASRIEIELERRGQVMRKSYQVQ